MVFQPFQLDEVKGDIGIYTLGLGMNAVISMLLFYVLLPKFLPSLYDSSCWTIKHHFILMLCITLVISVFNYIYNSTIGYGIAPHHSLPKFIYITFTVGVLPILIISYLSERLEKNKNLSEAKDLKSKLKVSSAKEDIPIEIVSNDTIPQILNMDLRDLLFAQAQNNYSQIYCSNADSVTSQMLRISLKELHIQIGHPYIIRCHKSYLVNKANIEKVDGNSRSLFVQLKNSDIEIPVSRSFDRNQLLNLDSH
jgi:hypothetical protein